ncbi:MAG TPA: SpoIIE family protein phosphatase [Bryobacteraceae bacterium]|nr:SpoIIE family protein phosphatase [Bryobacteraceae bacterium]
MAGAALTIFTTDGKSGTVPLASGPVTLGRSTSSDLSYPEDSGLSRQHLIFEPQGEEWIVRDPGSKNGSKINSVRLVAPHVLRPGDQIVAGHLLIRFDTESLEGGSHTGTYSDHTVLFVPEAPASTAIAVKLEDASDALKGGKAIRALIRAGQELSSHCPLAELFTLVLGLAKDAVGASRGVLMTFEGDNLAVRAAEGSAFKISTTVRDRVLEEKASLLVQDAMGDAAFAGHQSIVLQNVRSMMAVPLQANERVTGLIYVDTQDVLHPFTQEDLSLLTVMANVAAIRIEHARLAEVEQAERLSAQDLANAADIQRGFLPSCAPAIPGLDIAGQTLPCRGVGGDYFDYFVHPDGSVSLIVADVAGKGMPAALMMSNMQAHTQALMEADLSPARVLQRLNSIIAARCPGNRFITSFIARVDPFSGEMLYCNAGHNPPLLVRTDGSVDALEGGGMLLGVLKNAAYEDHRRTLYAGDILSLYTDGATEACPAEVDEEFGDARLAELLAKWRTDSAVSMLTKILGELTCWISPAHFADDVTLIVARRTER